jgi:NADH dehydrogenase
VEVTDTFPWRLDEAPDPRAFAGAAAVVHLSHSWASDSKQGTSDQNLNLVGTLALARAAMAAGVPRFIFASTTSARPSARNVYGRIKHAIEQRLEALPGAEGRVIRARIGLVYGGPETGQYGLMSRLVRLTPILPMIGIDRRLQPIHLDEVCAGLLALTIREAAPSDGGGAYVLAGPVPMTFGDWLRLLRRAHTGKGLVLIRVPLWAALLACDVMARIPLAPKVDRERVLGLAGTEPMESAAHLAALGIAVAHPAGRLGLALFERRRLIAEAVAMLRYVSGRRTSPAPAVGRLVRGIARNGGRALGLPRAVLRFPTLLRAFEPWRPRTGHRLAERLHLAAMVSESMAPGQRPHRPGLRSVIGQLLMDILALPCRAVLGGRFA